MKVVEGLYGGNLVVDAQGVTVTMPDGTEVPGKIDNTQLEHAILNDDNSLLTVELYTTGANSIRILYGGKYIALDRDEVLAKL